MQDLVLQVTRVLAAADLIALLFIEDGVYTFPGISEQNITSWSMITIT